MTNFIDLTYFVDFDRINGLPHFRIDILFFRSHLQWTDKRKKEADRIIKKYPERIPVICEKAQQSDISDIDKKKFCFSTNYILSLSLCIAVAITLDGFVGFDND